MEQYPVVELPDGQRGIVIQEGAFVSTVEYRLGDDRITVLVPNEDLAVIGYVFEYEEQ